MKSSPVSMATLKKPKKPKLDASKTAWDSYEKRIKAYDDHKKKKKAELERRKKIGSK